MTAAVRISEFDSGPFALAVIASVHRRSVDLHRVRHEYTRAGDRMSMDDLVLAARAEGFKARAFRSTMDRLPQLPLPAIARNRDGTFFILARVQESGFLVQEMGRAPTVWTPAELAERWSGDLILVTIRERLLGLEQVQFGLQWFVPVAVRFRALFGEVLFVSLLVQILGLVTPLFFQVVVDKVLVHKGFATLDVMILGLLVVTGFEAGLSYIRTYLLAHTTSRVDAMLGSRLFNHLLRLPVSYFIERPTGLTVARVRELETVRNFLTSSALTLTIDLLFSIIFIAVMLWYSVKLTLVVLLSLPLFVAVSLVLTPILRERVDRKFQFGAMQQSYLVESLAGIETLKAMAIEPHAQRRFEDQSAAYIDASFRVVSLGAAGAQLIAVINKVTTAAVLWFGAHAVISGELSMGSLIAFNMLAGQVSQPILRLAQLWQDFQQFRISIERLGDVLSSPIERSATVRHDLAPIEGHIAFEDVVFRFKPSGPEILRKVNLTIQPGEVVGIVGRSGSGKSTLTKLIQRFYVPEAGKVLVDGTDVSLVDPAWLRRQIGVVLQESVLFNRSIRENIALANPAMPPERIIHAAELAGAHDFIAELPNGYDTVLEERGANLSGGQRQRIAIARALITNPRILIFDEATSALDYESERLIQANMRQICQGRTVILIAHRLSTVRFADRIIVMDRGRIAEQGSHEELVHRGGAYAELLSGAGV